MGNNKDRLDRLLDSDTWSSEERQWMREYLNNHEVTELQTLALERYKAQAQEAEELLSKETSSTLLNKIHQQTAVEQRQLNTRTWATWAGVAASALLLILFGVYHLQEQAKQQQAAAKATTQFAEVTASNGHIKHLVMDDGTSIWLNAGSRLRFPEQFAPEEREVQLTGEAYFEVAPNSKQPFVIYTASLTTRVTGTSLNVKAYQNEQSAEVTVVSGEVKVSEVAQEAGILLKPNRQLSYDKAKKTFVETEFDASKKAGWREGKLYFNNVPLTEVVLQLQRRYDVTLTTDSTLSACTVYADFNNEPVQKVLKLLAASVNASVVIAGPGYHLKGAGCVSSN